ncbi:MAG TPA: lytic transglycosylase domain-containing protein [Gaiellaceae bacterium]
MPALNLSPPALVRQLRADERGFATTHAPRLAQDRQSILRMLGRDAPLARAVIRLAPSERDDVQARLDLQALSASTPPLRVRIRIGAAAPEASLLAWYREGERRFGVRWQVLAAVNFVESGFGKVRNNSVSGAQGPMQFIPATWRAYGLGGDVHDPHDAILGAANYLAANHGRTDIRTALWHYNPSHLYVDAVMRYAHRMTTVKWAFDEYYRWRIYIRRAG